LDIEELLVELEPAETRLKESMPPHLKVILKDKKIKLWERLLQEAHLVNMLNTATCVLFVNGLLHAPTEFHFAWLDMKMIDSK